MGKVVALGNARRRKHAERRDMKTDTIQTKKRKRNGGGTGTEEDGWMDGVIQRSYGVQGKQTDKVRSSSPAIHFGSVIRSSTNNLRTGVQRTAAEGRQQSAFVKDVGQSEIGNLRGKVSIKHPSLFFNPYIKSAVGQERKKRTQRTIY